jgi:hypothetical protein
LSILDPDLCATLRPAVSDILCEIGHLLLARGAGMSLRLDDGLPLESTSQAEGLVFVALVTLTVVGIPDLILPRRKG